MARIATVIAVLVALPATAFAMPRSDAPAGAQPLARVVSCDVTSANRAAAFYARMDSIPGASKMQIRFQLLERLGRDEAWTKLDVPALRQWHTSQAGVKRFGWKQTVDALRLGGAYKARVQYRWLAANGTTVDSDTRDTSVCRGPLPNIAISGLAVKPGPTADTSLYRVTVDNSGKLDAAAVDVSLSVDRAILDTVTITQLAAGESRTLNFTGPSCRRAVRVTADPNNAIGETIENDNSRLFTCP
jgi:hypothetical protein